MKLTETDKQIFCTALNKLDNNRSKEISNAFSSGNEFDEIINLQKWKDEQIIVYKDLSREATDYRNENTELKKELESWKNTVITQHKVFEEQEKQIEQLKSTLDEIREHLKDVPMMINNEEFVEIVREALARYEVSLRRDF